MTDELECALEIIEAVVGLSESLADAIEEIAGLVYDDEKPDEVERLMTSTLGATNRARLFVATVREDL